jgi:hypothetical protein
MGINFNELPDNAGGQDPESGTYYIKIESAEMKQPKEMTKPQYLAMRYTLSDRNGKKAGTIFDNLFESNHEAPKFKLKRFILALELPIEGEQSFELADLAKIVVGKELIGKVEKDDSKSSYKSQIAIFEDKVFYSLKEAEEAFGDKAPQIKLGETQDEGLPF